MAINETLSRTIMTHLTTMITIMALLVFGGEVLRGFSVALAIGVIVGTYSSIYIAERHCARPEAHRARPDAGAEGKRRRGRHALSAVRQ